MSIGETIKKIRNELDMSQKDLAVALGCGQSFISKIEIGFQFPDLKLAKKIINFAKSRKIKISLSDIFSDDDQ